MITAIAFVISAHQARAIQSDRIDRDQIRKVFAQIESSAKQGGSNTTLWSAEGFDCGDGLKRKLTSLGFTYREIHMQPGQICEFYCDGCTISWEKK